MFKNLAITVGILLGMLFIIKPIHAEKETCEVSGLDLGDVDISNISFDVLNAVESENFQESKLTLRDKVRIGLELLKTDEGKEAVKQHILGNKYKYIGGTAMICIATAVIYWCNYCKFASGK